MMLFHFFQLQGRAGIANWIGIEEIEDSFYPFYFADVATPLSFLISFLFLLLHISRGVKDLLPYSIRVKFLMISLKVCETKTKKIIKIFFSL